METLWRSRGARVKINKTKMEVMDRQEVGRTGQEMTREQRVNTGLAYLLEAVKSRTLWA